MTEIHKAAVVGAGTMGNGIAQVFASAGIATQLVDIQEACLERGLQAIKQSLGRLVKKTVLPQAEADAIFARIQPSTRLTDLAQVDLVVEAIPENLELKRKVFTELDRNAPPAACLATNTSSISITAIATATRRPAQVIGMHFMNPVPIMKLVEVIRGQDTSDQTTALVMATCERLGKVPVAAQDYPGFISNRVLMPMINEAIYCLMEGVSDRDGIDQIMKLGMAHPMGPLTLADFIGLDVCLDILEVLHRGLGDDKYRPCPLLRRMVAAGHLGRKSGRGFYDYSST